MFRILCGPQAAAGKYGAQVGMAQVPDERLDALAALYQSKKITRASIQFVDAPPLVNDPEKDKAVLGEVRGVDAFVHVVRLFGENTDPGGDIGALETEFILIDHDTVSKRVEKVEKELKKNGSQERRFEKKVLEKAREALVAEVPLRALEWTPEERAALRGFMLLSAKPVLLVLNAREEEAPVLDQVVGKSQLGEWAERPGMELTAICGTIESELAELDPGEAEEFLASYGLKEAARGRMVQAARRLLGLMTIFTAGENEARSWFVPCGSTAFEFAEMIHSDIAKRFVKAEVVAFDDLIEHNGMAGTREKGLVRLESKQYQLKEGDVIFIRHTA